MKRFIIAAIALTLLIGCSKSEIMRDFDKIEAKIPRIVTGEDAHKLALENAQIALTYGFAEFDEKEKKRYREIKSTLYKIIRCKFAEEAQEALREDGYVGLEMETIGNDKDILVIFCHGLAGEIQYVRLEQDEGLFRTCEMLGFKRIVFKNDSGVVDAKEL